jgi:PKD repeat protein
MYEWDLDGGRVIRPWDGQNIIASWNLTGTYTVTLRVDDQDGGRSSDTAPVHINNPPTADAGGPYAGTEAIPITLDGTASDPDRDPITYTWNFGDGDGATGTLQPQHTYVDSGVYTATLRVVDIWGAVATDTARVDIAANGAPTANTGGPYTGTEGNSIRLRGTADDPEGDPLTYEWNLGDGSPVADTLAVDHTYADNGVYTAILRVVDIWGGTAIDTTAVTIDNQDPVADTGGPYTTMVDTPLTLRGSASDVPADALIYTWDLNNDGTFETPGQDVVFTSALTGTFRVVLRVDDDDGGFGEAETTVEVNTLAPVTGLGGAYLLARARQVILRRRRSTRKFKYTKHDEGKTNGCSV